MSEYLKCPKCGSSMVEKEGTSKFFGCSKYPNCNGTRQPHEKGNRKVLEYASLSSMGGHGECIKCETYCSSRSVMGLCNNCQEDFDND